MFFEVEQKFPVDDPSAIRKRLAALGATAVGTHEQIDRYFAHPARDFARTDEALRLRRVGEDNYITYKGPKIDATTKTRREIELALPPGSSYAVDFSKLLVALGFSPVGEVHKTRQEMLIDWEGRGVHIALDDVAGVGTFLELELRAEDADLAAAKSCLASLAAAMQLSGGERRSYLELLLERQSDDGR